jgi:uncharacterized protein YehS (DUF1456 family)
MSPNDILRRLRYIFDLSDKKMIEVFELGGRKTHRGELSAWLKKEQDPELVALYDDELAAFLNGLIIEKRGRREGPQPTAEKSLSNNIVLRKLKIALDFKSDDILAVLDLADLYISKYELSAFFRKPTHKHYRKCKDQVLRNFLFGLQLKYRPKDQGSAETGM